MFIVLTLAFNLGNLYFLLYADNEAPTVACPSTVASMNVDAGMPVANVTWSPLPSANDTVDGSILAANIMCENGSGTVVMSGDTYVVGLTSVTCRANDTALNEGSCEFNITVVGKYTVVLFGVIVKLWSKDAQCLFLS